MTQKCNFSGEYTVKHNISNVMVCYSFAALIVVGIMNSASCQNFLKEKILPSVCELGFHPSMQHTSKSVKIQSGVDVYLVKMWSSSVQWQLLQTVEQPGVKFRRKKGLRIQLNWFR